MTQLSGLVAIVQDGAVVAVKDLGPTPIDCKPNAFPLVEVKPSLLEGEQLVGPVYTIGETEVTATYTKLDAATVINNEKTHAIDALEAVILQGLFNHENRIRTLAGQATITVAQFKNGLKALI
jgi:hypothetical protein